MIQGIRTQKNQYKAVVLRGFHILDMVVYEKKTGSGLFRIKEFYPQQVFERIHLEIRRSAITMFMLEFLNHIIKEEEPQPELFQFLEQVYILTDSAEDGLASLPLFFVIKMMHYAGIRPENNYSSELPFFDWKEGLFVHLPSVYTLSREGSAVLSELLSIPGWENFALYSGDRTMRATLLGACLDYFRYHIDHFGTLHSPSILQELFS